MLTIASRQFQFGPHIFATHDQPNSPAAPFFLAGPQMYVVGWNNGTLAPIGAEHLVGNMGGIWVHPMKVGEGVTVAFSDDQGTVLNNQPATLTEGLSQLEWRYTSGPLRIYQTAFVAEDAPLFVIQLKLMNTAKTPFAGELLADFHLKLLGCWFGGLHTQGGEYWAEGAVVRGTDRAWRGRWGVVCGASLQPNQILIEPNQDGCCALFRYPLMLQPGEHQTIDLLVAGDNQHGDAGALATFQQWVGRSAELLADKRARLEQLALQQVQFYSPDPLLDRSFALAVANLHLLSTAYPSLPPYFLAGIPEYPQLFGCDTEYTIPGATAVGFASLARSSLQALAHYAQQACGRVPHEVTTNGRVFHPGNTQETPQFSIAVWDYLRWSGDLAFLREVYPLCREGVEEYMPALWGGHGQFYPIGDGMVERLGMGSRKLDSTCYLFQALEALEAMATVLGYERDAEHYRSWRTTLAEHFEHDWWLEDEQMYADSLHSDLRPQLDGHWTVMLPLQIGMANPERARRAMARIEAEWVNQWGLVHTRHKEELVWTLPTGLLALTAFRLQRPELGVKLLRNIGVTAEYGTLGTLKELIPIGLCFVQLWSAGLLIQGITEGLFGMQPRAHQQQVIFDPQLPAGWETATLRGVSVGEHRLDCTLQPMSATIAHRSGPNALEICYFLPAGAGPLAAASGVSEHTIAERRAIWARIMPGSQITINAESHQTQVAIVPVR
jgi:hypothetical protein